MARAFLNRKKINKQTLIPGMAMFLMLSTLITYSYFWNINNIYQEKLNLALAEAKANWNKDAAFRKWATAHGGIYVKPNLRTPPNEALSHIPDRDIETKSGMKLTLMNPAYMMRQMAQEFDLLFGIKGKITGKKQLNLINKPDDWQLKVLNLFEQKQIDEYSEQQDIDNQPYLRYMKPMFMTDGCVKCHAILGYRDGDLRGGVSVSIPLSPYFNAANSIKNSVLTTHAVAWLFVSFTLFIFILFIRNLLVQMQKNEQELIAARIEAEKSELAKGQFLATMSHEIRTPMNGVLGINQLLAATKLNQEQQDYVNTMTHSGQTLLAIINDILDFSKMSAGEMQLHSKDFDLKELVNETVNLLVEVALEKQIMLLRDIANDCPNMLKGDNHRLQQVLFNLLGNAIKFTHQGQVKLQVKIKSLNDDNVRLLFEITDTGIGISPEKLSKLFTPFTQADSSITRDFGGTGLGLTISKNIVEMMDGEINVKSTPDVGSIFSFELPFFIVSHAETSIIDNKFDDLNISKKHILLVEDNRINQKVASLMLKSLGCELTLACNGQEAIEYFENGQFDLILMDCQMPVMGGLEATKKIRQLESGASYIPIIAVTANAMESDKESCIAAGMDDFITKPLDKVELTKKIRYWLVKDQH